MGEHQYVIYSDALDYPGKFVVRRFFFVGGVADPELLPVGVMNTLEEARKLVPDSHGYMMERMPHDEKQILEIWMTQELGEKVKKRIDSVQ
jgi:hypothetical protein